MRLVQAPDSYYIDSHYGRLTNIIFTTKQYKDLAVQYHSGHPIISIDEPESDQLEKLYPIGSIYINKSDPRNPKEILGFGEWTRLENTFLYCSAKDEAKQGGSETTTLQVENIPEHQHSRRSDCSLLSPKYPHSLPALQYVREGIRRGIESR